MLKQGRRCTNEYCIIPVRLDILNREEFLLAIRRTGERYEVTIACLNQKMIAGFDHVETALTHAIRAWKEERMIARSLEMEILLYAAGTRQTGQIASFGPETGMNSLYLCIIPPRAEAISSLLEWMREIGDEDWNEVSPEKMRYLIRIFGITNEELEVTGADRLSDLIRERCALLTVNK